MSNLIVSLFAEQEAPVPGLFTDQAERPTGNLVTPAVTKLPKPGID